MLTRCRTHLKRWIALVVVVQCLVLLFYLYSVSNKDASAAPERLVSQVHAERYTSVTTKHEQHSRTRLGSQEALLHAKSYPEWHLSNSTRHNEHLKRQEELKKANEILFRKIGSKKQQLQRETPEQRAQRVLKKSKTHQIKWAEKAERHRKQKQNVRRRNDNTAFFKDLNIRLKRDRNWNGNFVENSNIFGRELKKLKIEADEVPKGKSSLLKTSQVARHTGSDQVHTDEVQADSKELRLEPARSAQEETLLSTEQKSTMRHLTQLRFEGNLIDSQTRSKTGKDDIQVTHTQLQNQHSAEAVSKMNYLDASQTEEARTNTPTPTHASNDSSQKKVVSSFNLTSSHIGNLSLFSHLVSIPEVFQLNRELPTAQYFETRQTNYSKSECFKAGTLPSLGPNDFLCSCKSGWHGKWCSFPDSVYYSIEKK